MVQTQIYQNLAPGIPGEYADDSPRREAGYVVLSNVIGGAAATGSLTFAANPADNDTITIGSTVYRFKTTLEQANDIKIGAALTDTLTSLDKTINGEGEAGVDYFAGTTSPLTDVTANVSDSALNLTAEAVGIAGNAIALGSSAANVTVSAFAGGIAEVSYNPTFAHAFTETGEEGVAKVGGDGVFAGVLVNPKMYVNFKNLLPTMELPNGSQGGLSTMGHIFVVPAGAFKPGYVAAYDKTTGKINAYVNEAAVPATSVVIKHAQFIRLSGNGGEIAILQLGD